MQFFKKQDVTLQMDGEDLSVQNMLIKYGYIVCEKDVEPKPFVAPVKPRERKTVVNLTKEEKTQMIQEKSKRSYKKE